jgi:hypothetical protein
VLAVQQSGARLLETPVAGRVALERDREVVSRIRLFAEQRPGARGDRGRP